MTDWQTASDQNAFEMLAESGGPGFWVRRLTWDNSCARVVASGELTGVAPYYGNPSVLMDVYSLDGIPRELLAPLPAAGTFKTWRRWPEPVWAKNTTLRPLDDPKIVEALYKLDKKRQKLPGMRFGPKPAENLDRVLLTVPFARKDEAKQLGARWDPAKKAWWLVGSNIEKIELAKKLGFVSE
ncbi:DUF5710 domain-containing protein [Ferirhizobium litorale]|uniref:DUF5710 domain-containing protein n=1 Tax=Ferirhizobium litorale TaxID=2927786 RepID=A0AAE3QE51_9HYPH|nr:DUF5710 domain-containing protein [Fererhizobium litorale]MDI7923425.1 DUF5710 domain-containing protein [Fererhizobium litorale]